MLSAEGNSINQETKKRILELNGRGLTIHYIEKHLNEKIPQGIIKKTIEQDVLKDSFLLQEEKKTPRDITWYYLATNTKNRKKNETKH